MSIGELRNRYREKLLLLYGEKEANNITRLVFETELELSRIDLSVERFRLLTEEQQKRLNQILQRLLSNEPVQYVLEVSHFYGLKFKVDRSVLIPRPETEELVEWIIADLGKLSPAHILDIGTGTGCIAISLAKNLPQALLEGLDISGDALAIAGENNKLNETSVRFFKLDILNQHLEAKTYDIIVSNPPYIAESERTSLAANVLSFEPHLALFAPAKDDLTFYRGIAQNSIPALKKGGAIYFEINETKGEDVTKILHDLGYVQIEIKKDMSGKNRMVKGIWPSSPLFN